MTPKERAAMQQALEALEDIFGKGKVDVGAITALREALNTRSSSTHSDAEYSEVAQPQGEWVDLASAWAEGYESGINDERESEACIGIAGFGAKISPNRQNPYTKNTSPVVPQGEWVDLTDDEVQKLWNDTSSIVPMWAHHLYFARAVIAADREKNK